LAPSDFYLFPKLKLFLVGKRLSLNQEVIAAVEGILQILLQGQDNSAEASLE
jgi:hypothetical protein